MSSKPDVVLIDLGNTKIKSAEVFEGKIGNEQKCMSINELDLFYPKETPFCICNTGGKKVDFPAREIFFINYQTKLPITLNFKTPKTLGSDRIAGAVGCMDLFPNQNCLLIDMGTCVTMDFVSKEGVFEGGIISPGLKMRMRAMAESTATLPDISGEWNRVEESLLGKSTKECLLSGSYFGILHEINSVISKFEQEFTTINVILSGGDAKYFESKVKAHIFVGSKIVLNGMYRIWKNR